MSLRKKIEKLTDEEVTEALGFDSHIYIPLTKMFPEITDYFYKKHPEIRKRDMFSMTEDEFRKDTANNLLTIADVVRESYAYPPSNFMASATMSAMILSKAKELVKETGTTNESAVNLIITEMLLRSVLGYSGIESKILEHSRSIDRIWLEMKSAGKDLQSRIPELKERLRKPDCLSSDGKAFDIFVSSSAEQKKEKPSTVYNDALSYALVFYNILSSIKFDDHNYKEEYLPILTAVLDKRLKALEAKALQTNQPDGELSLEKPGFTSRILSKLSYEAAGRAKRSAEEIDMQSCKEIIAFKRKNIIEQRKKDILAVYPVCLNIAKMDYSHLSFELCSEAVKMSAKIDDPNLKEIFLQMMLRDTLLMPMNHLQHCIKAGKLEEYVQMSVEIGESLEKYEHVVDSGISDQLKETLLAASQAAEKRLLNPGQYRDYLAVLSGSYLHADDYYGKKQILFSSANFIDFIKEMSGKEWKSEFIFAVSDSEKRKILLDENNLSRLLAYDDSSFLILLSNAEELAPQIAEHFIGKKDAVEELAKVKKETVAEILSACRKHRITPELAEGLARISGISAELYSAALDCARRREFDRAEFIASIKDCDLGYEEQIISFAGNMQNYSKRLEEISANSSLPEELSSQFSSLGFTNAEQLKSSGKIGEKISRFMKFLDQLNAYNLRTARIKELAFEISDSGIYSDIETILAKTEYSQSMSLAQFNKGTDEQYASAVKLLAKMKPRHVKAITKPGSPAGDAFFTLVRYCGNGALSKAAETLSRKSGIDTLEYLKSLCDRTFADRKKAVYERMHGKVDDAEIAEITGMIDSFCSSGMQDKAEVFEQFLQIDAKGRYISSRIPLAVASLVNAEQYEVLRLVYSQIELGADRKSVCDMLDLYRTDHDLESMAPEALGIRIKKKEEKPAPEKTADACSAESLKQRYLDSEISREQFKSACAEKEREDILAALDCERMIIQDFRRRFKRDYNYEPAIRIRQEIKRWMFKRGLFVAGHYPIGAVKDKISCSPHERGLIPLVVDEMAGKEIQVYHHNNYQLDKKYPTIKEMIRMSNSQ